MSYRILSLVVIFSTYSLAIAQQQPCHEPPAKMDGIRHYMVVFSAQTRFNLPRYAHSFAVFVKMVDGADPEITILSWLPETSEVYPFRLRSEPGRNHGLDETLDLAAKHKAQVSMWGPYEIHSALYDRALRRSEKLDNGDIRYRAMDPGKLGDKMANCYHIIGDISVRDRQLRFTPYGWGDAASYFCTLALVPHIYDAGTVHPEISEILGLSRYCILERNLDHIPTRFPVLRAIQAIRNRDLLANRP